ncbi:MAG: hypothetical protein FWH01_12905 [Oscillospiraceae bacterium]|nr:hypothetical protein [Oscillospiraceae bacterium]
MIDAIATVAAITAVSASIIHHKKREISSLSEELLGSSGIGVAFNTIGAWRLKMPIDCHI